VRNEGNLVHPLGRSVPPPESIALPAFRRPRVTVVIPMHGQLALTLRCLASLVRGAGPTPFRAVVVDDASGDESAAVLDKVAGLRVVALDENVGYLRAVNEGARDVDSPYLCLLNNDVELQPGALQALVATLDADAAIGLAGARLVDMADGTLQEAGGIVFDDGSAANYGRGESPTAPAFQHVRDVDYCSAAAVVVRTELWRRLGGFDERYAPAYYEDVDLAFGVRSLGYRVVYEPNAVVEHVEGASHGRDETSGLKAYQVRNRHVFAAKWRHALTRQCAPGTLLARARDRSPGPRVVVIDAQIPAPDRDAGWARAWELVQSLRRLGAVVTVAPMHAQPGDPWKHVLRRQGVEVLDHEEYVGEALAADPDLVMVARIHAASKALLWVRRLAPRALLVFDTVDLHHVRVGRGSEVTGDGAAHQYARALEELEYAVAASADVTLTVSEVERGVLLRSLPNADVRVLSLVHLERAAGPGFADRRGVLFVGSYGHSPNVDGARYLAQHVMPLVREVLPGLPLWLVGGDPPAEVLALADAHTHVPGWLPDLTACYDACRVVAAPLRYGAGVKGKVVDAMGRGVPTVLTPVAAEGMAVEDGVHTLVGRTPAELAGAIVRLHEDRALWCTTARNARRHVSEAYSAARVDSRLAELLDLAVNRHGRAGAVA
jgi:GT2 family glycosyltransferase